MKKKVPRPTPVLEHVATCRGVLEGSGRKPPYVVFMTSKRMAKLRREMDSLGAHFGLPLDGRVPDTPEDEEHCWIYFGIMLADVHVFGRLP